MLGLQLAGVAMGLAALAFFALFGGYYFRNRRMAMEARKRQVEQDGAAREEAAVADAWGDDEHVG